MNTLFHIVLATLVSSVGILNAQYKACHLIPQTYEFHVNHIRTQLSNRGYQFYGAKDFGLQVPYKGQESPSAFFIDNLWIAGFDSNLGLLEKRPDYPSYEYCGYAPGPIDWENAEQTANQWNKIFSVSQDQILAHIDDFSDGRIDAPQSDIFGWPATGNIFFKAYNGFELHPDVVNYAGFYETAGNRNGIYEPHLGEYPLPEGVNEDAIPSETIYRLISTVSGDKGDFEVPLADVHHTTFAYQCDREPLNYTLFSKYRVVNRSSDTLYECRIGLFADGDIGNQFDDYFGCDPEKQMVYFYNSDNLDEDGRDPGYGQDPPVVSMTILGKEQMLHSLMPMFSGDTFPIALSGYRLLDATWGDNTPLTAGGTGYNPGSSDTTNYAFTDPPGDPNGWSMLTHNIGQYGARCIISTVPRNGHADLWPGASRTLEVGYTFHRNIDSNHVQNVNYAIRQSEILRDLYEIGLSECLPSTCDCECLWPGDSDLNGKVDYIDALNIYRTLGQTGPKREGPLAWFPSEEILWSGQAPDGINASYSDVNGDGLVDLEDLRVLEDFIGSVNTCHSPITDVCEPGSDFIWVRQVPNDSVLGQINSFHRVDLQYTGDDPIEALTFEIKFDDTLFHNISMVSKIEWEEGESHRFEHETAGSIGQVIVNKRGEDLSFADPTLFSVIFLPQVPSYYDQSFTEIAICNALVHFADGRTESVKGETLKFWMPESTTVSSDGHLKRDEVMIFPNPTEGLVEIEGLGHGNTLYSLYSIEGTVIRSGNLSSGNHRLDVSLLNPGIYFLELRGIGNINSIHKVIVK